MQIAKSFTLKPDDVKEAIAAFIKQEFNVNVTAKDVVINVSNVTQGYGMNEYSSPSLTSIVVTENV